MPIGKNAIKRVENNGYSKVKTTAPDMENSHVIANISEEVMEKMVKPVEEKTAKKAAAKKPVVKKETAKKTEAKKPACKKSAAPVKEEIAVAAVKTPVAKKAPVKKAVKAVKPVVEKVELGNDMPYYLL